MRTIALYSSKGGVGKGCTCFNLSASFSEKGYKILLIDVDFQCNLTSAVMLNKEYSNENVINVLNEEKGVFYTPVTFAKGNIEIESGLSLLAGSKEVEGYDLNGNMYILREYIKSLKDFDIVFIDNPPGLTDLTINSLCAADLILSPVTCSRDAMNGLEYVLDAAESIRNQNYNPNLKVCAFLNNVDKRRSLDRYYSEELFKENDTILKTQIHNSSDIVNSYEFGLPVSVYKKSSKSAKEYDALRDELIKKYGIKKGAK